MSRHSLTTRGVYDSLTLSICVNAVPKRVDVRRLYRECAKAHSLFHFYIFWQKGREEHE